MNNKINEEDDGGLSDRRYYANLYITEQIKEIIKGLIIFIALTLICGCLCYLCYKKDANISMLCIISGLFTVLFFIGIIITIFKDLPKFYKYKKMIYSTDLDLERVEDIISTQKQRSKKAIEESKIRQAEFEARQAEIQERKNAIEHPECPTCKSHNTRKITTANRATSVAAFGLASGKIGKSFECKDCGYKW